MYTGQRFIFGNSSALLVTVDSHGLSDEGGFEPLARGQCLWRKRSLHDFEGRTAREIPDHRRAWSRLALLAGAIRQIRTPSDSSPPTRRSIWRRDPYAVLQGAPGQRLGLTSLPRQPDMRRALRHRHPFEAQHIHCKPNSLPKALAHGREIDCPAARLPQAPVERVGNDSSWSWSTGTGFKPSDLAAAIAPEKAAPSRTMVDERGADASAPNGRRTRAEPWRMSAGARPARRTSPRRRTLANPASASGSTGSACR